MCAFACYPRESQKYLKKIYCLHVRKAVLNIEKGAMRRSRKGNGETRQAVCSNAREGIDAGCVCRNTREEGEGLSKNSKEHSLLIRKVPGSCWASLWITLVPNQRRRKLRSRCQAAFANKH